LKTPTGQEITSDRYGRISIADLNGGVIARYGGGPPNTPGNFTAPHGITVDSSGAVYVAEVTWTIGVSAGIVGETAATIQKLERRDALRSQLRTVRATG
jgi:hypothetical protein